ncbi:hypothetical protein [Stygiolobus caldivivus]|uniref:hypothetical protein n=1 Tax=Stygiolobus caldivivus TaxID=2824673 RepID=UPI001C843130|nr:hypothetical protein [Stygiolobus caldivivus]
MICKEIECVEGVVRRILEQEGKFNVGNLKIKVSDLPYDEMSKLDGNLIIINSVRFRNFSNETGGDSKLVSAYLIVLSLYAIVKDRLELEKIISNKLGMDSVEFEVYKILFS